MVNTVDSVVVGAGSLGCSVTFHLASLGQRVVLVDRRPPVSETTLRAAGLALQVVADDVLADISIRSVDMMSRFKELTGQDLSVFKNGSIKIARRESDVAQIEAEVARGLRLGVEISQIEPDEAQRLAPWLSPESAQAIWYAPNDLYLNPAELPQAYLRAAEGLGASIRGGIAVTEILRDPHGRSSGVMTTVGGIDAENVVIAAGAWTRRLAELVGTKVPLWTVRHQLCITGPIDDVKPLQPTVRIIDARTYSRPAGAGLMFGAYEPNPIDVDVRQRGPDFGMGELELDMRPLRAKMESVRELLPIFPGASIVELRGGLPTMTPDGYFVADTVQDCPGLWVLSGCNVGGLSNSPALGHDLAQWIVSGRRPASLEAFGLDRFGTTFDDDAVVREAALATYSRKYTTDELATQPRA
jgi:glycine/D-amino acid oxidase-like deaminating enzyme